MTSAIEDSLVLFVHYGGVVEAGAELSGQIGANWRAILADNLSIIKLGNHTARAVR